MARSLWCMTVCLLPVAGLAAGGRPMGVNDLFALKRVGDPQISPDGKWVVYQVGTVDLAGNKSSTNLWLAATDGRTPPRQLTTSTKSDRHPRWSPDGSNILFESTRSGDSQLWVLDITGGEARQLTTVSTGASNGLWSPDGKKVAFVSAVYPEFSDKPFAESDKKNKEKLDEVEKGPVKAKVFTRLFYRHWDEYVGDRRQHLLVIDAAGGEPRDVTPGDRDAFPTSTTFSSGDDYTFSPDGSHLVFTAVPAKHEAWSTNYDICRVSVTNSSTQWETLTKDNHAADGSPRFSPNGKMLAWRAQQRAAFEADRWEVRIVGCSPDGGITGKTYRPLETHDFSANEFTWAGNERILLTTDRAGRVAPAWIDLTGGTAVRAEPTGAVGSLTASRDGKVVTASQAQLTHPPVVVRCDPEKLTTAPLADPNAAHLEGIDLPRPEIVSVPVEGGAKMLMWVLKPPRFDDKKKWPVAYLVHGGPQGAWEDAWSNRWNPSLWAAQGYVVVLPNPRGSTGFGQKFVDEISGDWGGKCYRDLVAGLDYVEKLPYVDKDRIGAAGASFGGYMMNWFAVNHIAPRFKCLITHCSVWNFESMWGTTDELWFDEYEHGGLPWEKPGKYAEFSPHKKAGNLGKYKTPMLVVHNDLDFRCPIGQGHELFTALQRQGVPSRFVNFPDEGHWVLKPKNSEFWHKEVFGWLKNHCPPGGR